jgi:hypothetical protein
LIFQLNKSYNEIKKIFLSCIDRCQQDKSSALSLKIYAGYFFDESIWFHCPVRIQWVVNIFFLLSINLVVDFFLFFCLLIINYLISYFRLFNYRLSTTKRNCKSTVFFCLKRKKMFPVKGQSIDFPLDQFLLYYHGCVSQTFSII